ALEFLQVQLDEQQSSTYQFVEGVAPTSLAALTASRLGVTFERLVGHIVDDTATDDETSG
ncbi:MAG: hypothetical protein VYE73_06050, partial [Acidobacteriota bacterium]|nr:hypothetical protein [Acidobacteriota bacterium]